MTQEESRIFELTEKESLITGDGVYKFSRDFYKTLPKIGRTLIREFTRKGDGKQIWFSRNLDLENCNGFWRIKSDKPNSNPQ